MVVSHLVYVGAYTRHVVKICSHKHIRKLLTQPGLCRKHAQKL